MTHHYSRDSIKFLGTLIDPENAEDLQRTKTDIESNISKILKLVKNKSQSTEDGNHKHSTSGTELVGLVEGLYKKQQSLYASYDHVTEEIEKAFSRRIIKKAAASSSDSDSEYFSSEEVEANKRKSEKESEERLASLMEEVESLSQQKKNLEFQVESEVKHLTLNNTELHDQVLKLELLLKEEKCVASNLQTQLNEVQQRLDSIENMKKELEAEMERQRKQNSQDLIQIVNLKDKLAKMKSVEHNMVKEKEGFLEKIEDLELNLESQNEEKDELEEKLRETSYEVKQLADENKALQDRNHELRTAMTQKGEEISIFLREHENHKNGASIEVIALKAKVNGLRLALDTMHELKNKLEQQNERIQKEYTESQTKMETLNSNLETQVADQEKTIERLSEENKHAKIVFSKLKLIQVTAERKMNELAEEYRRKMEDNIKLLHQRIHVAEQLNNENKYSAKVTKQRYEEENRNLGLKIASYKEETTTPRVPIGFELIALNGLDIAVEKIEKHASRVSRMTREVEYVKDCLRERNGDVVELRERVDSLGELLEKKEEQELLLRENVWQLEAQVSKEGGDKLNLRKHVSQLEKKVGKLDKYVKEKDEELTCLGEKKREAIRQLCFVVEFHRDRCNYLKDMLANKKVLDNFINQ